MAPLLPPANLAKAPPNTTKAKRKAIEDEIAAATAQRLAAEKKPFTALVLPNTPEDVANASDLLAQATGIVSRELTRLNAKSFERGLDPREVNSVITLVKAIAEINAEERLLAQRSKLDSLSDDELRQMAKELISKREGVSPANTSEERVKKTEET